MNQEIVDLYYDPFDFDIDDDPYPVWRRMREEAPLYYNERHDFYALSGGQGGERAGFKAGATISPTSARLAD
ncbi:Putative cytochrome P450 123 [Mycobacterium talmoniae]|uniref:Cytochrome P450 123 n=1 Tax=Mycobacterium talmoniae TaxID=1858794 RepID=A0A1S1NJT7_9MYCO|nr:hypothetical protein BKN37_10570 [Mycobacterium talmoniae]PQM48158.1 Putative cytochrome P450 123 [Mycobacterium talmoniae]